MKKLMSIVVSILFAFSLTGLVFAQAPTEKSAAESTKSVEKAPAKAEKKAKKAKKAKKTAKSKKAKKAEGATQAPKM
jgi:hypothetical protein